MDSHQPPTRGCHVRGQLCVNHTRPLGERQKWQNETCSTTISLRIPKIMTLSHKWPWRDFVLFGLVYIGSYCRTKQKEEQLPEPRAGNGKSHGWGSGEDPATWVKGAFMASTSNRNDKQGQVGLVAAVVTWLLFQGKSKHEALGPSFFLFSEYMIRGKGFKL